MEDVIIVSIVFGFSAFVCTGIYKLIMAKMNRSQGIDSETFQRLAETFIQHKEEMNRRVRNLEAIIANEQHLSTPQIDETKSQNDSMLKNDLKNNNKKRIQ
ncbi:hypothetical protein SAMN05443144_107143 [Fodinibius roseus]|uniref:Uncharacterized protein n=1 Tax=Fodinibius roseus TaxID=1194090 RepID=A0A1M5AQX8_9BACT|nr:hypothetical protein [Fodinibius roseus]SHF32507.1 hypothetical protein SAMN05443144_107143 [Fodinibius roseus]